MNVNNTVTMVVGLVVGVLLVAGLMVPVIASVSSDEGGSGGGSSVAVDGIRYSYGVDDVSFTYGYDGQKFVMNGEALSSDDLVFASDTFWVFMYEGSLWTMNRYDGYYNVNEYATYYVSSVEISITNGEMSAVDTRVFDGEPYSETVDLGTVEWAYSPDPKGEYVFSDSFPVTMQGDEEIVALGVQSITNDSTLVRFGDLYGGRFNYEDSYYSFNESLGRDLEMHVTSADQSISDIQWYNSTIPSDSYTIPTYITSRSGTELTDGDWRYIIVGDYAVLTEYIGAETSITIPNTIGSTYTVKELGIGQQGRPLIPNTVKSVYQNQSPITQINDYAFYGASPTAIFPHFDSLEVVGEYAFSTATMKNFVFTGVKVVKDYAFYQTNFTADYSGILIYNNVMSIGSYAFAEANITANAITIGSYTSESELIEIKDHAFYNADTNIVFLPYYTDYPRNLKYIGDYAFYGNTMGSNGNLSNTSSYFLIPDSVAYIGSNAFDTMDSNVGMIILQSPFEAESDAFSNLAPIKVLNLTDVDVTSVGLDDSDVIQGVPAIKCMNYVGAPSGGGSGLSPTLKTVLSVIPLVTVVGIVLGTVGYLRMKD